MKEIPSIVTQDGQLIKIGKKGQQDGNSVAHIRIKFSGLSDYILAALKGQKPFAFSIRSGNGVVSFITDPSSWYKEYSIPIAIVKKAQQKIRKLPYEALRIKNPGVFG